MHAFYRRRWWSRPEPCVGSPSVPTEGRSPERNSVSPNLTLVYWADSTGRRNTSISRRCAMGYGKRQLEVRGYRGQIPSPGRPTVAWRQDRVRFWAAIAAGAMTEDAAAEAGVSSPVGFRWFRHAGGVNPRLPETVSGRYLSSDERRTYFVSARLRLDGNARCGGRRAIPAHLGLRSHAIVKRHHRVIRWRPWWSEPTGIVAPRFARRSAEDCPGRQTISPSITIRRERSEPITLRFRILPASPPVGA